jgi:Sulfotransferase family
VSSDRPVFVVGCPRSGTTLLSLMLHAHPNLAMPPETRFLITTWRRRARYGDLRTRQQRRALAARITRDRSRVRDLGLDPAELSPKIISGPPTIGSAFGIVFREFAQLHGRARWGDKRPGYYQEVDVLLRLFPDAQIVHIIRDGRATVASLKQMPWWRFDSIATMAAWSLAESCLRRDQRRLPADTFYALRYETLVADTEGELRKLCAFLDEDFHDGMLEPHRVAAVVPDRKHWHGNLKSAVSEAAVDSWRTRLEPWELGLMETVLRRKLRRNGYELSGAGQRPTMARLLRWVRTTAATQLPVRKRWRREQREADRATYPVAAQLTSRQIALAAAAGELVAPKPTVPSPPTGWPPSRPSRPRHYRRRA